MKRALISVSDKTGLSDFAKGLQENGYEIISTGGTKKPLKILESIAFRSRTLPDFQKLWMGG